MLERLVYVSTATSRLDLPRQAADIALRSAPANARDDLSGALVAHDGHFIQVIEGPPAALDALLRRLEADDRHYDLTLIDRWRIESRVFEGWAMALAAGRREDPDMDAIVADATTSPRRLAEQLRSRVIPVGAAIDSASESARAASR